MKRWRLALLAVVPIAAAGFFAVSRRDPKTEATPNLYAEEMKLYEKEDRAREAYRAALRKTSPAQLVSRPVLGSAPARAQAHRDLAELRRATTAFYTVRLSTLRRVRDIGVENGRRTDSFDAKANAMALVRSQTQWRLLSRLHDLTEATLKNADDGRAEFFEGRTEYEDSAGRIVFVDQAHYDRYVELYRQSNRLAAEMDALAVRHQKEYDALKSRYERERDRRQSPAKPRISPLREASGGIGDS